MGSSRKGACHSCARRRLRCDRSRPSCHKCTGSGLLCPGYERVFTWIQGPSVRTRKDGQTPRGTETRFADGCHDTTRFGPSFFPLEQFSHLYRGGLDGTSWGYLNHFQNRVCNDLVAHDHPGKNPFLQLIPLALEHPFILHILIANSALHLFNITHRPQMVSIPSADSDAVPWSSCLSRPFIQGDRGKSAFAHALGAKQRALSCLRTTLQDAGSTRRELLLAAVLLFINFELIDPFVDTAIGTDSGTSNWQPHLRGAGRLMLLLSQVGEASHARLSQRILFDIVISDCFIYHILGSTVSPSRLTDCITDDYFKLFPILERTEAYCYLCCPTAILQIILKTSRLSVAPRSISNTTKTRDRPAPSASELLQEALKFNIQDWTARRRAESPTPADHESREHVASAHRSAACLYILQALPQTRAASPVSCDQLVDDIIAHLARVDEHNPHFKATAWPSFVAGAETRDHATRRWLLERLLAAWKVCPWGYIFTAVDVLQKTWRVRDASRSDVDQDGAALGCVSGLQQVWAMDTDFLVV